MYQLLTGCHIFWERRWELKLSHAHYADTSHSRQHTWIIACRSQVWAVNKKLCHILAHENFTNFMAVSIIANQLFFGCIILTQWHRFHGKYTTLGTFQKYTFPHHRSYTIYPEATQTSPMDWATLHLSPAVKIASKAHFSVLPSDHPQFFPYTCWQQRLSVWPGPRVRDKVGKHQLNLHGLSTVAGTLTKTCLSASAELDVWHLSSVGCIQCNTSVTETQNGQPLPQKCPGAVW